MTGPRAERRSDEKVMTEIKREDHSKETRADLSKKSKRQTRSTLLRSPRSNCKDGRGSSQGKVRRGTCPSGKQPLCYSYLKGKRTKPSSDCWHPPEWSKTSRIKVVNWLTKRCFIIQTTMNRQAKSEKQDSMTERATIAIVGSSQKWSSLSQNVELPEPASFQVRVDTCFLKARLTQTCLCRVAL